MTFTASDRRLLHAVARKLDLNTEVGLANLAIGVTAMKELDDLVNETEDVVGTQASAVAAINRLADLVDANATDPAKLAEITGRLRDSSALLAQAIDATAPPVPTQGGDGTDTQ